MMRTNERARAHYPVLLRFLSVGLMLFWGHLSSHAIPRHVYLTWQGDTSTTMTVNYQTMEAAASSSVYYDTEPREGAIKDYRFHATGTRHKIDRLEDGRTIHWVELAPLKPGTTYYFVAGDPTNGFTAERKFQTIPLEDDLRFVIGGDMGSGRMLPPLLKQAAEREPNFGVVGGDIAYANDQMTNYARWDAWLDAWQENMVTPKGLTIPMVLAIGNHEVSSRTNPASTNAFFYLNYFAQQPGRSYFSRQFGEHLVIYLLDSGHLVPHGPHQAAWLDAALETDRKLPHRFAVYHVPLYPAHREYEGSRSVIGRNVWLPIFDKHHLTAGFEHHDHVFKRTKLLRNNEPNERGTLYLGDGAWGMPTRTVDRVRRWYEAKAANLQHFWLVDVSRKRVEYRAINADGKIFDVYPPDAKGAKDAEKVFSALTQSQTAQPRSAGE
jgi:acid phosphatase type 7